MIPLVAEAGVNRNGSRRESRLQDTGGRHQFFFWDKIRLLRAARRHEKDEMIEW